MRTKPIRNRRKSQINIDLNTWVYEYYRLIRYGAFTPSHKIQVTLIKENKDVTRST